MGSYDSNMNIAHCCCGCSFCISVRYSADGTTCHIMETAIPPDHFDVDENQDNWEKDKEVGKLVDALIVEHCFSKNYGHLGLYRSFIAETSLTARFLEGSSWRINCITLGSISLDIIMKLVL